MGVLVGDAVRTMFGFIVKSGIVTVGNAVGATEG